MYTTNHLKKYPNFYRRARICTSSCRAALMKRSKLLPKITCILFVQKQLETSQYDEDMKRSNNFGLHGDDH